MYDPNTCDLIAAGPHAQVQILIDTALATQPVRIGKRGEMDNWTAREAVLEGLRKAGVPKALREGTVNILARAGYKAFEPPWSENQRYRKAFGTIDKIAPRLMQEMKVLQSQPEHLARKNSYAYARLCVCARHPRQGGTGA